MTTPDSESINDQEFQAAEALTEPQSEVSDEELKGVSGGAFPRIGPVPDSR